MKILRCNNLNLFTYKIYSRPIFMYVFLYNIIEDIRICHLECQISTINFSWLYVIPKLGLFKIRTNSVDILLLKIDPTNNKV